MLLAAALTDPIKSCLSECLLADQKRPNFFFIFSNVLTNFHRKFAFLSHKDNHRPCLKSKTRLEVLDKMFASSYFCNTVV